MAETCSEMMSVSSFDKSFNVGCNTSFCNKLNESSKTVNSRTQKKILLLLEKMPELNELFDIHSKVGEGTFSTVYKATLKNKPWDRVKEFAIKHLVPTSNQQRIVFEFKCMANIGGKDNVVGLIRCLRNEDNIAFVMPYIEHEKFSTYMLCMDVEEVQVYMKNLLLALKRVHSFNIIHRDVKPNNFLYDRRNNKFLLVDFGLAEEGQGHHKNSAIENSLNDQTLSKKRKWSFLEENEIDTSLDSSCQHLMKRQALQPLTANVVNSTTPPIFKKPNASSNVNALQNNDSLKVSKDEKECYNSIDTALDDMTKILTNRKSNCNEIVSPKRQPLSSNSLNLQNGSPQKLPGNNLFSEKNNIVDTVTNGNNKHGLNPSANNKLNNLEENAKVFQTLLPSKVTFGNSFVRVQNSQVRPIFTRPLAPTQNVTQPKECECDGKPQVCNTCLVRKRQYAPRAGTPGFRPPEVLLKYPNQTTAVDIWAAGVIFISILSGSYPFFKSPDDISGLAEVITLFGTDKIKNLAAKYGKKLFCNIEKEGEDLQKLCERLRRRRQEASDLQAKKEPLVKCDTCGMLKYPEDGCICNETTYAAGNGLFPDSAYDLLYCMLDTDPDTRITADEALKHPFISNCVL